MRWIFLIFTTVLMVGCAAQTQTERTPINQEFTPWGNVPESEAARLQDEAERERIENAVETGERPLTDILKPGSYIDCDLNGGIGKFQDLFAPKWATFNSIPFSITKGKTIPLKVARADKEGDSKTFWISLSSTKDVLSFCTQEKPEKPWRECREYRIAEGALGTGFEAIVQVPDIIDNAPLLCTHPRQ
jgi:hypothetical protein